MFRVRATVTASGKTAVQVIHYEKRKRIVVKHIGSTSDKKQLQRLKEEGRIWIEKASGQHSSQICH